MAVLCASPFSTVRYTSKCRTVADMSLICRITTTKLQKSPIPKTKKCTRSLHKIPHPKKKGVSSKGSKAAWSLNEI